MRGNFLGNNAASNIKMAGFCTIFFLKSFDRNGLDPVLDLELDPEPEVRNQNRKKFF
jgi:hypothetical protein